MIHTIDVALSQLGVAEATGKNDGIPAERYMRGDKLAWCAGFVLYCNEVSDDPCLFDRNGDGVIDRGDLKLWYSLRSVAALLKRAQELGIFVDAAEPPVPNDLIFFGNTTSDVGVRGNHVGIVEAYDPVTDRISSIEGNYSNRVSRVVQRRGTRQISGFGRISLLSEKT